MHQDSTTRLWTRSFVALSISSFLLFLNLQMLLSSFPAYVKGHFDGNDLEVSLVTSVFAIAAIAARFGTAALTRRYSRRGLLIIGVAAAVVTTAAYIAAASIGSLLVMRALYGIGFGIASTIIPTLVSQIIPAARMGEGIGYFGLSSSLAMSIGPVIGMNVMKHAGFGMLAIAGAAAVALIVPVLLATNAIPPEPVTPAAPDGRGEETVSESRRSSPKQLLIPALLNMLLSITYSGLLSFIALFGEAVHLEQVGLFFLFNVITILLIRPISGKLFDSKGHGAVLIPAAICVLASMLVLSHATSLPMLIVSALLYGLGFGAIQPTIQAWMIRSVPKELHGTANSMFYNSTDLGIASGALLLGVIAAYTSYGTMYEYSAGFMLLFLAVYGLLHFVNTAKGKNRNQSQAETTV